MIWVWFLGGVKRWEKEKQGTKNTVTNDNEGRISIQIDRLSLPFLTVVHHVQGPEVKGMRCSYILQSVECLETEGYTGICSLTTCPSFMCVCLRMNWNPIITTYFFCGSI